MGSTNLEVEQTAHSNIAAKDEENVTANATTSPDLPPEKNPEVTFDTGVQAWLQVLGSFFLFFNSWYVFR